MKRTKQILFMNIRTLSFGDSKVIKSTHKAYVPVYIGNRRVHIETEVGDKELSLLLSKEAMKEAGMRDFINDSAQKFVFTSTCKYTVTIVEDKKLLEQHMNQEEEKASIAVDVDKMSCQEKEKMATKVHNQFGHPS